MIEAIYKGIILAIIFSLNFEPQPGQDYCLSIEKQIKDFKGDSFKVNILANDSFKKELNKIEYKDARSNGNEALIDKYLSEYFDKETESYIIPSFESDQKIHLYQRDLLPDSKEYSEIKVYQDNANYLELEVVGYEAKLFVIFDKVKKKGFTLPNNPIQNGKYYWSYAHVYGDNIIEIFNKKDNSKISLILKDWLMDSHYYSDDFFVLSLKCFKSEKLLKIEMI